MPQKNIQLSKSRFIAGLQCPKRLYLSVFPPEGTEKYRVIENMPILNGYAFGDLACRQYPGVMVDYDPGLKNALVKTQALIADSSVQRIHEATFKFDDVLVRVDLLERCDNGWILTEVKASTSVKPYYLHDVAIQTWVLQGCGLNIVETRLMHVNNQFIYQGDDVYDGLFQVVDVTASVMPMLEGTSHKKEQFMEMLKQHHQPDIAVGKHCNKPYACQFIDYCHAHDAPETSSKEATFCASALQPLKNLAYPRYYLDFETIGLSVPRWKGAKAYQQIPFQWSCHIQYENGDIKHQEFLDISGDDPRRACAESLIALLGNAGVVVAYHAPFEKSVIAKLADALPDLAEPLRAIHQRFFDLLPLTRGAYEHPCQQGSWSLKAVLPALVPDLSYASLDGVQHGEDAQKAWFEAVCLNKEKNHEKETIKQQLLAYCKMDTWAMVKIVEALLELER